MILILYIGIEIGIGIGIIIEDSLNLSRAVLMYIELIHIKYVIGMCMYL